MPVKTLRALRSAAPGLSGRTAELLQRADAELVAAQFSSEPWEQFTHAHLAALRAGAAVLAERQPLSARRGPRTVWELLDRVAPEMGRWSAYFAAGAGHEGLKKTVPANLAGAVVGWLIVQLSGALSFPGGLAVAVAAGAFVMCVQAGWSVLGFVPGAFIGCSAFFGTGFDFWPTVLALVAGAVLGWASFWGGEGLARLRRAPAPVAEPVAG